jgi:hypothetical protein
MRRRVAAVAAVIGLVAAIGVAGSAVAAKRFPFRETPPWSADQLGRHLRRIGV